MLYEVLATLKEQSQKSGTIGRERNSISIVRSLYSAFDHVLRLQHFNLSHADRIGLDDVNNC